MDGGKKHPTRPHSYPAASCQGWWPFTTRFLLCRKTPSPESPKEPLSLHLPLQIFSVKTFRDRKEGPPVGPTLVSRLCTVDGHLLLLASAWLWSRTTPWAASLRARRSVSSPIGTKGWSWDSSSAAEKVDGRNADTKGATIIKVRG